jgi:hypothetical protein
MTQLFDSTVETGVVVRDMVTEDIPEVRRLWEKQGLDYRFPDMTDPLYFRKKVIQVDGRIVNVIITKVEVETIMINDREWGDTEEKVLAAQLLLDTLVAELKGLGLNQMVAWVPTKVEKAMEPHLKALGWEPDRGEFHTWSKEI